jgi:hypothetical protein
MKKLNTDDKMRDFIINLLNKNREINTVSKLSGTLGISKSEIKKLLKDSEYIISGDSLIKERYYNKCNVSFTESVMKNGWLKYNLIKYNNALVHVAGAFVFIYPEVNEETFEIKIIKKLYNGKYLFFKGKEIKKSTFRKHLRSMKKFVERNIKDTSEASENNKKIKRLKYLEELKNNNPTVFLLITLQWGYKDLIQHLLQEKYDPNLYSYSILTNIERKKKKEIRNYINSNYSDLLAQIISECAISEPCTDYKNNLTKILSVSTSTIQAA